MASPVFTYSVDESQQDILNVCVRADSDNHPEKMELIPGAYRDEKGQPWVMPFIHNVEREILESSSYNHEYVIFLGLEPFKKLVPPLIFGEDSPALKSGRAFGIQTVSGSGALRIGAELLVRHCKYNTFYLSDPTWDNHELLFLYAGFKNSRTYRYWDPVKRGVNFEGMLDDLRNAPENSVIVLQMCSHNPTGCDITKEQWVQIADVMQEKKLFPFIDAAYQGFATADLEQDAWPVRYFTERGFEMLVAQTFSKNLGLYSERTGCLNVVLKEGRQKEKSAILLMLTVIVRALYLCPGRHGAEIAIHVLQNPKLCEEWKACLKKMVARLIIVRQGLRERLEKLGTPGTWDHITTQKGMFSFTGLTRKQVAYLADKHHIYLLPNGRANMCALNNSNLDKFAEAVHEAILQCPS